MRDLPLCPARTWPPCGEMNRDRVVLVSMMGFLRSDMEAQRTVDWSAISPQLADGESDENESDDSG